MGSSSHRKERTNTCFFPVFTGFQHNELTYPPRVANECFLKYHYELTHWNISHIFQCFEVIMLVNGQRVQCAVIRSLFKLTPKSFDMTLIDDDSFFIYYLPWSQCVHFLLPYCQQTLKLCREKQCIKTTRWTRALCHYWVGHDWQLERTSFRVVGMPVWLRLLRFWGKKHILHSYRHLCISGFFKSFRKSPLVTHVVKSLMY